jgi:hypothetical protein
MHLALAGAVARAAQGRRDSRVQVWVHRTIRDGTFRVALSESESALSEPALSEPALRLSESASAASAHQHRSASESDWRAQPPSELANPRQKQRYITVRCRRCSPRSIRPRPDQGPGPTLDGPGETVTFDIGGGKAPDVSVPMTVRALRRRVRATSPRSAWPAGSSRRSESSGSPTRTRCSGPRPRGAAWFRVGRGPGGA